MTGNQPTGNAFRKLDLCFPKHTKSIRDLWHKDEGFQEACEDLILCLDQMEKLDTHAPEILAKYKEVRDELQLEILTSIEKYEDHG